MLFVCILSVSMNGIGKDILTVFILKVRAIDSKSYRGMSDIVAEMSNWKAPTFVTLLRYFRCMLIAKTFLVDYMHVYLPSTERKTKMHGLFEEISLILCLKFACGLPGLFECAFPAFLSDRRRQPISGLKMGVCAQR